MSRIPEIDAGLYLVRSVDGDYAAQICLPDGKFIILTDDLAYPGGIGWAAEWKVVDPEEVPEEVRRELQWAVEGYIDYVLSRE
jgi:uncharacterized circularly permuted ATP-grasp superfamily protein